MTARPHPSRRPPALNGRAKTSAYGRGRPPQDEGSVVHSELSHSACGITAVASISRRASGSTRRLTSTSVMAGKLSPITAR